MRAQAILHREILHVHALLTLTTLLLRTRLAIPGGPFDHQKQGRRSNGHLDTKKRYGREQLFGREKAGKAMKKCAFGREKTALGREKA